MSSDKEIEIRPYRTAEASYVSYMQMDYYNRTYGFRPIFEQYLLAGLAQFLENPEGSQLWVALDDGRVIGSVAVCRADGNAAQLRWFFIDEHYQGRGIGKRMVDTALAFCKANGYSRVFLWTAEPLKAARHIYGKYGFRKIEEEPNAEWTGDEIVEELWEMYPAGE